MLILQITAPFASFTNSRSREYSASFKYPPISTIYGLLLSLVGESHRTRHVGVKLAIGIIKQPKSSVVLRTFKRLKEKDINAKANSRPDFQEILCGLSYAVCVDSSEDKQGLENRIQLALTQPEKIDRFGGLSLGESRDLIDDIRVLENLPPQQECFWLLKNPNGEALPVWVDYQGSENTRWETFILRDFDKQAFCLIQDYLR